jgi:hypothetical protein
MDGDELISRREVEGMLLAIYDIRDDVSRLVRWIEEDDGGEEEEAS